MFKDISNFNNVNDYLPILNGCINADLIIIFLLYNGVFKSRLLGKWYQKYQLSAVIHDILFYWFFKTIPTGYNAMLDFFKDYATEVGSGAILGDSFMMIIACLLSSYFATYSLNSNLIILILSLYFVPYMINY